MKALISVALLACAAATSAVPAKAEVAKPTFMSTVTIYNPTPSGFDGTDTPGSSLLVAIGY